MSIGQNKYYRRSGVIFVILVFLWIGVDKYYETYSPQTPDVQTGKVYEKTYGEQKVYLTLAPYVLLTVWPYLSLWLIAGLIFMAIKVGEGPLDVRRRKAIRDYFSRRL